MQNEKLWCKLYLLFVWARILLNFRDLTKFYLISLLGIKGTLIFIKMPNPHFFNYRVSSTEVFFMALITVEILGLKIYAVQAK
jgi:hypothetical protein